MVLVRFTFFLTFSSLLLACNPTPPVNADGSPDAERLYTIHCASCHKMDGTGGIAGAKNLGETTLNEKELIAVITKGRGDMMPFEAILNPVEIEAVVAYISDFKK